MFYAKDPYLKPYRAAIKGRMDYVARREEELAQGKNLQEWANGYLYFGLHCDGETWYFREWAPNATAIYLKGDMNNWEKSEEWRLRPLDNGVWEGSWPKEKIQLGQFYKLLVEWQGGWGERIPSYAFRVVQDPETMLFSAQVVLLDKKDKSTPVTCACTKRNAKRLKANEMAKELFIYECHIGMATEEQRVGTYDEFRKQVLPRIADLGYNCIQIMAIQEHPYYGSFGYHVSNFFAASSRFGTPDELQALINDAHVRGIAVIMDLVHSHCVKNEREGLSLFDGTPYQYFHAGARREHPAWDSLCFDYGKPEVIHFLLSNCKFWMDVYGIDGFRFDGVTSMMYLSHGLGENFSDYSSYYNGNEDGDAICYLTLANKMIHQSNRHAITIAEDMSGMPGLAAPIKKGGMGFNYRLAMGIPDFWIKYIKEVKDEDWKAGHIFYEMTNRRGGEKTISYAESHDQALVGDKTIIFRLVDSDMYWHFEHGHSTYMVDRGIALHKMIRLITAATAQGGYLNFMGNEFGHPEWIDFPRQGNNWSYQYARRQWSLVDNPNYFYSDLNRFDKAMVHLLEKASEDEEYNDNIEQVWDKEGDQVMAFRRGRWVFVFNWHREQSFTDYGILLKEGKYQVRLNTDSPEFGGFGLTDDSLPHFTLPDRLYQPEHKGWMKLYLPARSAVVLEQIN